MSANTSLMEHRKSVIWKFKLTDAETEFDVWGEATPLAAGVQGGDVVVWVKMEAESSTPRPALNTIKFAARNTGAVYEHDPSERYVGTVTVTEFEIVWHIFQVL